MKSLLGALGGVAAAALLALGALFALGRTLGVGPFAPGAPTSWLYLAISRSGEEGDARDIEVIDLASGERQLFAVDERAFDLALSRDRRTLYVGTTNGRILELDALRGAFLREIKLATTGEVRRLVVLPDGGQLIALTTMVLDWSASLIDLATRREKATLLIGNKVVGPSLARPDVLLSVADRANVEQLLTLNLDPFRVREETLLASAPHRGSTRTAAPTLRAAPDGSVVALSPFTLRLVVLTPSLTQRRGLDLDLGRTVPFLPPGFDGDVVLTSDGQTLHFCVGTGQRADRFRADWQELRQTRTGTDCGRFARLEEGGLYLAVRGRAELKALDPASGEVRRTLPLAGFPQRVAY